MTQTIWISPSVEHGQHRSGGATVERSGTRGTSRMLMATDSAEMRAVPGDVQEHVAKVRDLNGWQGVRRFLERRFDDVRDEVERGGWTAACPCCPSEDGRRFFIDRSQRIESCSEGHTAAEIEAAVIQHEPARENVEEPEHRDEPGCDDVDEEPLPMENKRQADTGFAPFVPFDGANVPPFPVDVLPPALARYVEAVAKHIQVPVDGVALTVLATLAAVCAKRIRVRRIADGYEQPLNLYLMGLGESGERKSQIVSEVLQPLREYERRVADDLHEEVVKAAEQRKLQEERAKWIRKNLAAGKTKGDPQALRAELDALAVELAKCPLRSPRLVTSEPTQGALEGLLVENGERMAIVGAEGGVFGIVAGRFSGNSKAPPDMDIFLSGWSGDAGDSDRKTTAGARLRAPALTIGLFVQPQVFQEVSNIYGADEKGLTSRFLVALVESNAHRQKYLGEPMDLMRRTDWARRVAELLEALPADRDERVITLPTDILGPAEMFFNEVTAQMAPGGELSLPALRGFGSKLRGQLERFVGILHMAQHGPEAPDIPCTETTVAGAVELGRYFLAHGKAARSATSADPVIGRAKRLIEHCLFQRLQTFARRDAQMGHWGGCRKPEDLDAALLELVQRGYLSRKGRLYHVRPELLR